MKGIPFREWYDRFKVIDDNATEANLTACDDPAAFAFFDNGAVKDLASGDFVIKADQVREEKQP